MDTETRKLVVVVLDSGNLAEQLRERMERIRALFAPAGSTVYVTTSIAEAAERFRKSAVQTAIVTGQARAQAIELLGIRRNDWSNGEDIAAIAARSRAEEDRGAVATKALQGILRELTGIESRPPRPSPEPATLRQWRADAGQRAARPAPNQLVGFSARAMSRRTHRRRRT